MFDGKCSLNSMIKKKKRKSLKFLMTKKTQLFSKTSNVDDDVIFLGNLHKGTED